MPNGTEDRSEAVDSSRPAKTVEAPGAFDKLQEKGYDPDAVFKPKTPERREATDRALQVFFEEIAKAFDRGAEIVPENVVETIEAFRSDLDRRLTEQLNLILHHPEFQALEATWRGLDYLVSHSETDEMLKIRVLNVSKQNLVAMVKDYKGVKWDRSPLFKKVYRDAYDTLGAAPYGCLVGDYSFDHSPSDVDLLSGMAKIAAAGHTPFISAADPKLFQYDTWLELPEEVSVEKIFSDDEYAPWRALREAEDARFIALAMPRFLGRLPYGAETEPVEEFDFEEETDGTDHARYLWVNAAYAMAANINSAFKQDNWCVRIRGPEGGGAVGGLPIHAFQTRKGKRMKCPTEVAIDGRREGELAKAGLMPILHRVGSNEAVFMGAQSLQKPQKYEDPDASKNANLSARLPYIFAVSRFAHYLKIIVREKIGTFKGIEEMRTWLSGWIQNYVDDSPLATDEEKAKRPLKAAEVVVEEDPENPGYYSAKFSLQPHYQLEGLTVALTLVSKLPSVKP